MIDDLPKSGMIDDLPKPKTKSPLIKSIETAAISNPVLYPTVKAITDPEQYKSFAKGTLSGATFGTMGKEDYPELENSVMNPNPNPTARKVGQFTGAVVPVVASAMTGGAATAIGLAGKGLSPLAMAIMEGMGTGLTHAAVKGAATNQPIPETIKGMINEGNTFAALNAGGQFLGWMRKQVGEKFPEWLMNNFINTDTRIAQVLREKGKPSLGRSTLDKTNYSGFKTRDEIYDQTTQDLFQLENRIKGRLETHAENIRTPVGADVSVKGTPQLEYKPSGVTEMKFKPDSSGPTIATPGIRKEYVEPFGKYTNESIVNVPKFVPETKKLFPGVTEQDVFGLPLRKEGQEYVVRGGFSTEIPIPVRETTNKFGGFVKETPVGSQPGDISSGGGKGWKGIFDSVRPPEAVPFKVQRPGTVDFTQTVSTLDDLIKKVNTGTEPGIIARLNAMKNGFIGKNGVNGSIDQAVVLKRQLDDLAGNIYTKTTNAQSALKSEAYEAMANNLRRQIYELDPVLGELAAQESLLLKIRTGLLPKAAETGGSRFSTGFWGSATNRTLGSSPANLTADLLNRTLGTPRKVIAPTVGVGARTLTETLGDEERYDDKKALSNRLKKMRNK